MEFCVFNQIDFLHLFFQIHENEKIMIFKLYVLRLAGHTTFSTYRSKV